MGEMSAAIITKPFVPLRTALTVSLTPRWTSLPFMDFLIRSLTRLSSFARVNFITRCKGWPEFLSIEMNGWLISVCWLDDSSILGSIGVIFSSFGFQELMARQGVERRVITAGKSKSLADPFLAQKPEDIDRMRALQAPIHQAFIAHVKARRGARLADHDLFNADVWVGQQAVDLGLADGVAHLVPKLKALYGDKVRLQPMGQKRGLLSRLGVHLAEDMLSTVEERAMRAHFGM